MTLLCLGLLASCGGDGNGNSSSSSGSTSSGNSSAVSSSSSSISTSSSDATNSSSSGSNSSDGAVAGLRLDLIDTTTGLAVPQYSPLQDGVILNLDEQNLANYTIIAVPDKPVGSVMFSLNGIDDFRVESIEPYALYSDSGAGESINPWDLGVGEHIITATPYAEAQASGMQGQDITVNFSIVSHRLDLSSTSVVFSSVVNDLAPESQAINLINAGSAPNNFNIVNIPDWLEVSPVSGELLPGNDIVLSITSDVCVQVGNQSSSLTIEPEFGLPLDIQVLQQCASDQVGALSHFILLDVRTNEAVPGFDPLIDGSRLDVSGQSLNNFTVVAVENDTVGSVQFDLDGVVGYRTENIPPYALEGDRNRGEEYIPWNLDLGTHSITATPFSGEQTTGDQGQPISVSFEVVERRLTASTNAISLISVINQSDELEQTFSLENTGNIGTDFEISNIPDWLNVSPLSGSINVGESVDVILTSQTLCAEIGSEDAELLIGSQGLAPTRIAVRRYCGSDQATFDYQLDSFYFNQAVPAHDTGSTRWVEVVAKREGIARAFVTANSPDAPLPSVKLFWRDADGASGSLDMRGPSRALTEYNEANLDQSFHVELPADFFVPGREYYVEVDPNNQVPEILEFNNRLPENTGYISLDPTELPVHRVTFIPIIMGGEVSQLNESELDGLYARTKAMNPIAESDLSIRAQPYVYDNSAPGAGWGDLLSEIALLHRMDNSTRYYHAITEYRVDDVTVGIARRSSQVALSMKNSYVVAHEFGHNFSLAHAPCGVSGDPNYPYADAITNVYGYDILRKQIKSPDMRDFMSYCSNKWVSDWTFDKAMKYRGRDGVSSNRFVELQKPAAQQSLLVGGVVKDNQFSFSHVMVANTSSTEEYEGEYQLIGRDVFGAELFRQNFNLIVVDHSDELHFDLAIPFNLSSALISKLQIVNARTNEVVLEQVNKQKSDTNSNQSGKLTKTGATPTDGSPVMASASPLADDKVKIIWDSARYQSAMIKDLETGSILAINKTGEVVVMSNSKTFELTYTNGFASESELLQVH